ncbi:MAG: glycerate kinase [Deltaproteobacteria bacterium]|nr:glycerate kinase [Deltaproteobacteria bacterium]
MKTIHDMRVDALKIYQAGVEAVEPGSAIRRYCSVENNLIYSNGKEYNLTDIQNIYVVGAGKATAPMSAAIEEIFGSTITEGIVNVKYGHVASLKKIRLIEAGHPVPDANGQNGADEIVNLLKKAGKKDLVICLISGGGSALLPLPVEEISLKEKQETIKVLLSCGASIHEINTIRKHISKIKGGKLAKEVYPAQLITFILSDVVGDDMDVIASGPTVPDTSSFGDCMRIFEKYHIENKVPESVVQYINDGISGKVEETPGKEDRVFKRNQNVIIGSNIEAILAAKKEAEALGYNPLILSSMIQGETRHTALVYTAIAKQIIKTGHPVKPPTCVLAGGETTVTVKGTGKGGRNQEFALASVADISNKNNIVILSCGTDGNDGDTDAAGAVPDSHTLNRARRIGIDPNRFLENNDSYHFFEKLGDLIKTGPTNTNVMDIQVILVDFQP